MIFPQEIEVHISNNAKYYDVMGYGLHKQGTTINVNVFDLPKQSNRKILAKCDNCDTIWNVCYSNVSNKEFHRCLKCSRKYVGSINNTEKAILKNKERVGSKHPRWNPNKTQFKHYHREVTRETNKQNLTILPFSEKRGRAGIDGAYHLDHIISVKFGFDNNIHPTIIGSIENLRCISWQDNYSKRTRCDQTLGELFAKILINTGV